MKQVKVSACGKMQTAGLLCISVATACFGGDGNKIRVPDAILNPNTKVSCTVTCGEDAACSDATLFVSACKNDDPGLCFEIDPAAGGDGAGNTYFIGLDEQGKQTAIDGVSCESADESDEGLPLDLVFVIDTTSSMAGAINGVVASIDTFVEQLGNSGVKTRVGGIAFGDTAPLQSCIQPQSPFAGLTETFGRGTDSDPDSFNYWLGNLSASHCGDGGGDGPENALDAIEFVLGNDHNADDGYDSSVFDWTERSLHVIVVITDVNQHQRSDGSGIAHFDLDEVAGDVKGFSVVHVVGPGSTCRAAHPLLCSCNLTSGSCDTGCTCDPLCLSDACPEDTSIGVCDDASSTCDRDCLGYPDANGCDVTVGTCDPDPSGRSACASDFDCRAGVAVNSYQSRRCDYVSAGGLADVALLADVTGGAFTTLPADGRVDLTTLPLAGVITATEQCQTSIPSGAEQLRCVYQDEDGNEGEVVVDLK